MIQITVKVITKKEENLTFKKVLQQQFGLATLKMSTVCSVGHTKKKKTKTMRRNVETHESVRC